MAQSLLRDTCTLLRCKIRRSVCLLAPPLKTRNSECVVPYDVIMKTNAPVQFSSVHSFILIRKSFSTWADLPGNRIQGNDSKRRKEKNDNIYNYNYITSKSVHRVLIEIVLQAQFKDRGIITPSYDCRKRIP